MKVLLARYRRWLVLPASAWSGRGVLAFLAGVTAVLFFVGGVVGGLVADDYPRGGRLAGLGLAAYGAVGLLLVYRVVRGTARIRELVGLTIWWMPGRTLDAWINDSERFWHWPLLPLVVLVLLLLDGRKDRSVPTAALSDTPSPRTS